MNYWIPCWAGMPKRDVSCAHSDWVLVSAEVDGVQLVWFAQYGFMDMAWRDPEGRPVPGVIAWRELPEPFDKSVPQPSLAVRSAAERRRSADVG
jgi:hypothetical protein